MIYNLLYPLSDTISFFNVFQYITFRAVWALLTALMVSILIGPPFISWLKRIKFGQYIQTDGVEAHHAKAGTPTMGGLMIIVGVLASTLIWADLTNTYIWLTIWVLVGFGLVGFLDDFIKIKRKDNKGFSAKAKLLGQILVASAAMVLLVHAEPDKATTLAFPFFKTIQPDLGWFYVPFAVLVMVGASNGVNITDGLDGLAITPTIVTGACFAIFIYVTGNVVLSEHLLVPYVEGVGEVAVFCGALVGAGLGFLWFNAYPAQVFMGDVGSLSLGGSLGFIAILAKQELMLLIVGGLFVIETLSVILQVGFFKMSGGKRIFRMAPIHHHFELKGIPESKIIIRFWILSILFGLAALSTLKLR